ncbi:uncharacterized protein EAE98_003870 [Botrytis deweyae]|uniref:FAD/NAD(P)-binding domain-containing protein n=1 Tax=Botrytis deweyae TaxID=2478750 RepID=A0ABQ7IRX3_9HELO|nr:uncharacterized protein EAE98_003870 [Botrytis deweyae]KAF7932571.1 hypothetical protein EAE98_003870 [Botrytis deweyae]
MDFIDVAIIGGGPAGLTAAGALARQLHTAVVFDTQTYRNKNSAHMHMVPTWDHKDPKDFRAATKDSILARYSTIQFLDVGVTSIEKKTDSHFILVDANAKEWNFRKVILAVGMTDTFPEIEGYAELWTKRIFHCLFCFGYEDRGAKSTGVLVLPPLNPMTGIHMIIAANAAQLSEEVTLYTHGDEEIAAKLSPLVKTPFKIDTRKIQRLVDNGGSSVTMHFSDGSEKEEAFLVHNPKTTVQGPFVEQLGLDLSPAGDILAPPPFHQTSVRGVFAAGDCITPYKATPAAIASGCNSAVALTAQLQAEKHGITPLF